MSIRHTITPALLAGLLLVTPAIAQTAGPAATPATASPTRRDAMVERRITELHTKLNITAAEQKPFDDFAQAMRDNARRMDDMVTQRRSMASSGTAVDQLKSYSEMAQAHAQEVSNLVGPFSALYDSLSPEQKKMADTSFREFSERGMRGRQAATHS